jgi:hypothetical protein
MNIVIAFYSCMLLYVRDIVSQRYFKRFKIPVKFVSIQLFRQQSEPDVINLFVFAVEYP